MKKGTINNLVKKRTFFSENAYGQEMYNPKMYNREKAIVTALDVNLPTCLFLSK